LEGGTYEGENVTVVWKCEKCRRYKPIEEFRRSVLWENDDLEPAWICERCQEKEIEAILNTEPHRNLTIEGLKNPQFASRILNIMVEGLANQIKFKYPREE